MVSDAPRRDPDASEEDAAWVSQFCAVLRGAQAFVGPPAGSNKELAALLERVRRTLEQIGPITQDEFLLRLRSKPRSKRVPRQARVDGPEEDLRNISLEEVDRRVADIATTRSQLLRLAQQRFGAPVGTLRRLSRQALASRLREFAMNERGHQAVARMAASDPRGHSGEADSSELVDGP